MIQKLLKEDFLKVFNIMENSFPTDEYRNFSEQKALLENPYYDIYVWKEAEIKGFIAVWDFSEILFIEHFAIAPEFRNLGLGSKILKAISQKFDKMICLEVELPEDEITKKRVAFYERNGFFKNEYPYIQPPISKGKNEVDLLIMTSKRPVLEEEFQKIKNTLYRKVYNV